MTRTVQTLLDDARTALSRAGLAELDWTKADVVSARRTRTGLVVGELGWRSHRIRFACVDRSVNYKLEQQGASWRSGLSGTFAVRLVIHPRFGFQAEVYDVAPESLADATSVEQLAAVCARIEREGWAERQRSLPDPGVPDRVAVVSSFAAQGLADFLATIQGACRIVLIEAVMGGDGAVRSVRSALARAAVDSDAVVLLRGGGSATSMEWADQEEVVEAVATCAKPVWVAVGHADDHHLVDVVAHRSFATPTQAAAELRRRADERAAAEREADLTRQREAAEQEASRAHRRAAVARRAAIAAAVLLVALVVGVGVLLARGGI
ncbi:MAG: exodeoxyribonuclease VII large subunit [Acidimicrobiia bacterium]